MKRQSDSATQLQTTRQRKLRATPLARAGQFEEAASAALFLASGQSSYINGSVITLDGGRTGLTPGTF